ncbi:cytochrome d ubiquinol oxidase subunit II [Rugosimonospora africana]|uniref:Cytochrome D ubiquinol oxidase subunit II n=1 Tax=Rugosimonospora africana TaxID=556532 RepID=A0A8J3QRK8_9ACTN|nr:cytochrome d ubiquinol oxidase subunit II [Rugosimonospora africana]GIH15241.1 cytochrome D ubiquinol oxidase subunit II [Rugosimonospora africana]
MAPSPLALTVAAIMFVAVTAYALFAGADFGGGIWDMLAGGTRRGTGPRAHIDESVTPVWEANHVWLVLMLVVLWSAFPPGFGTIMTVLFVPLNFSLLGIFFRGVGFAFRHSARSERVQQLYGVMFAASSLMTPFFLGTVVGAIASGAVRVGETGNRLAAWTSATALLTGALAVTACAYIAAVYLVRDAHRRGRPDLTRYFAIRAGIAGAVSGLVALANLVVMHRQAPYVFHGLTHRALPLIIISVVAGTAALVLIVARRALLLLPAVAAVTVVTAVWGWAVAQYPYLLPTTLTLRQAAAPTGTMVTEIVTAVLVTVLVLPAFALLYWLQQHGLLGESSSSQLRAALTREDRPERTEEAPPPSLGAKVIGALLVVVVVVELVRRPFARRKRGG